MHVRIAKQFTFDAAHHLPALPPDHKCHRMHGHTYRAEVVLLGPIAANGFLDGVDYADIERVWEREVGSLIDHRTLNDLIEHPSTENLAVWIIGRLIDAIPRIERVRVSESMTTWCEIDVFQYRADQQRRGRKE